MSEQDLTELVSNMRPRRLPGEFVFVALEESQVGAIEAAATVREAEGLCAVVRREQADRFNLNYDFVAGWITLGVESALEAVGLTAAVSYCLSERGISCNVIAGLHHDHLLVPLESTEEALAALNRLSASGRT